MLTQLGKCARNWVAASNPWTNVYGLARTALATGTALTLVFSHSSTLFRPAAGVPMVPLCAGLSEASLFCVATSNHLELARWIAVAILLVVASGWRPRLTGLLHWWVSFSLIASAVTVDGGDQATAVLSLMLIPITLTDSRRWHWQPGLTRAVGVGGPKEELRKLVAMFAFVMIRIQVAGIYFHASVGKFSVTEWTDGTALYYWLTDPNFGASGWMASLLKPVLTNAISTSLLTWGVLVLECFLAAGLIATSRMRKGLLVLGLALHCSIALVQGLVSFGFAMTAALIMYLHPLSNEFQWSWIRNLLALTQARRLRAEPMPKTFAIG